MGTKLILKNVRCTYVFLTNPKPKSKSTQYGLSVMINKDDLENNAAYKEAIKGELTELMEKGVIKTPKDLELPMNDGDEPKYSDKEFYKGTRFFSATYYPARGQEETDKPNVYADLNDTIADRSQIERWGYSGAKFNLCLEVYKPEDYARLAVSLKYVLLIPNQDTPALFGSASSPSSDFEDLATIYKSQPKATADFNEFDDPAPAATPAKPDDIDWDEFG